MDIVGNLITTTTIYGRFRKLGGLYMYFDKPYLIKAGQQYIAATRVSNQD